MSDKKVNDLTQTNSLGLVNISEEVLETITNISTKEIEGVMGLYGHLTDEIAGIFTKKNHTRGVRVQIVEEKAVIDLDIVVNFGVKIPEVAWQVQENVKNAIENMTQIKVESVNVNVASINFVK